MIVRNGDNNCQKREQLLSEKATLIVRKGDNDGQKLTIIFRKSDNYFHK